MNKKNQIPKVVKLISDIPIMKSILLSLFLILTFSQAWAQELIQYEVISNTLNLRSESSSDGEIILELKKGDLVSLLEKDKSGWWFIEFEGSYGYVYSKSLKKDPYTGWQRKKIESGESPDCENYDKQYDYNLDNYLKINVGSHTNVVVKLMQKRYDGDICIRMAFVRRKESAILKNIPEGNYYLKIAYGNDWRQKIIDNQCIGKFMRNAHYEIGKERLDYHTIDRFDRIQIPSFELQLDMISVRSKGKNFDVNQISEAEFNK